MILADFLVNLEALDDGQPQNVYMSKMWAAMATELWVPGVEYDPDVDLPENNEWLRKHHLWLQLNPPPSEAVEIYALDAPGIESLRANPNHDPKTGRFTHSGSSVGKAMLAASKEPDGGATISIGGTVPKTGYVVAQQGTSGFVGNADNSYDANGDPTPEAIDAAAAYIKAHKDAKYLGAWHNPKTGEITFDVVDVYPDSIGDAEAMRLGKAANQEAIYHITTGKVIETGGTGDKRSDENGNRETAKADFGNDGRRDSQDGDSDAQAGEVDDHSDSAMVALILPLEIAKEIEIPDGEPADNMHITLTYLGDIKDLDKEMVETALSTVVFEPISGIIGGIGRFPSSHKEGMQAAWVPVDVDGLTELHIEIENALKDAGWEGESEHGFTPHVTLAYLPEDAPTPNPVKKYDVQWSSFALVWGNERTYYPLVAHANSRGFDDNERANPNHDPKTGKFTSGKGAGTNFGISTNSLGDVAGDMSRVPYPFHGGVSSGPEFRKQIKMQNEHIDMVYDEEVAAGRMTITREEWRAEVVSEARELLGRAGTPAIYVPSEVLMDVLDDERIKSQLETGHSRGMYDPAFRKEFEAIHIAGTEAKIGDSQRPIYGVVAPPGHGYGAQQSLYGEVEVVLHPRVLDRATVTMSDSLAEGNFAIPYRQVNTVSDERVIGAMHVGFPRDVAFARQNRGETELNVYTGVPLKEGITHAPGYVEMQVHGQVRVQDVDRLIVHWEGRQYLSEPSPWEKHVTNKANSKGIPLKIIQESAW